MRILILGGDGMLGHRLMQHLHQQHHVTVTLRNALSDYADYGLFTKDNSIDHVDAHDEQRLKQAIALAKPDVLINAIGLIKQRRLSSDILQSLEINAVLPHKLAALAETAGARLIHFSTDCVFRGDKGNYSEDSIADATDIYGRTKYLGEVEARHCLTLRTSIIGMELHRHKSLIGWYLQQKGAIKGYRKAIFSGLTTLEMSRFIQSVIEKGQNLHGVYNVASNPISKHDLLARLTEKLNRQNITIIPDDSVMIDRSLNPHKLKTDFSYAAPDWETMLDELAHQILRTQEERQDYGYS